MKTYNSVEFEQTSKELKYDLAIKEIFGADVELFYESKYVSKHNTPREDAMTKRFSMRPLWYLQFLVAASPARIVDVGCGGNMFKPVIKKLYGIECHGIDPTPGNQAADEFNFFDSNFSQGHTEMYESVFSINALHFIPLSNLAIRVKEFYNIVAPGGHGFLALNSARMIERTQPEWLLQTFESATPTPAQIQSYVTEQLSNVEIDFEVIDLLIITNPNESMDGNIRMVFKK